MWIVGNGVARCFATRMAPFAIYRTLHYPVKKSDCLQIVIINLDPMFAAWQLGTKVATSWTKQLCHEGVYPLPLWWLVETYVCICYVLVDCEYLTLIGRILSVYLYLIGLQYKFVADYSEYVNFDWLRRQFLFAI